MAIGIAPQRTRPAGSTFEVVANVAPSGSAYVNGTGETFDVTQAQAPDLAGITAPCNVSQTPLLVEIFSVAGSGFKYVYENGTTLANGLWRVYNANGTEINSGAYPGGVTSDVIVARITLPKMQ